jgi:ATP-binding cassette subfamily B multidrug efflux pump
MLSRFERYLKPTATPARPEPPDGFVGFIWHFGRQAKPLFVALFALEFLVALADSAIPWFMGRIVTLVTSVPPDRFLAETWPWSCRGAARWRGRGSDRAISTTRRRAPFSGLIRYQSHFHVVRQSWAFFQNDFAGRIANRAMQTTGGTADHHATVPRAGTSWSTASPPP